MGVFLVLSEHLEHAFAFHCIALEVRVEDSRAGWSLYVLVMLEFDLFLAIVIFLIVDQLRRHGWVQDLGLHLTVVRLDLLHFFLHENRYYDSQNCFKSKSKSKQQ